MFTSGQGEIATEVVERNITMDSNELFKEMCIEDETQYEYQHQESPNEDYFECEAEYLNGNWCC